MNNIPKLKKKKKPQKTKRFGLRFCFIKGRDWCLTCWIFPMNHPTLILKFHMPTTRFILSLLIRLSLTISVNTIFILLTI